MSSGIDKSGHQWLEFPMSDQEQVRVTYIPVGFNGGPTIRIQKRDFKGNTVWGPEFPVDKAMNLVAAVSDLATR